MHIVLFLLVAFSIYIITESFICFDRMHKGDVLCRLLKYTAAAVVPCIGISLYAFKFSKLVICLWLVPDLAVALFFWPTTYARFTGGFKNRIGDR